MCSRFELSARPRDLARRFDLDDPPDGFATGEVRPTNAALIIGPDGPRVQPWGFAVEWDKKPLINARSETLAEKKTFQPLRLSRGFAGALRKGRGAIVNVTSIAGHKIHPFAGSAYSISKTALSGLTREMANEFAELGVRVNAVAPGEIETEMIQPEYEMLIPRIPLGHMGAPEDVAKTIYYLSSDDSKYVTGTEIWVTGGQHMF